MAKNMTPSERREAILNVLCKRRQDTIANLAHEFDVSVRTIKYDIEELTLAHPIETIRGRYGGGVKVADGYYIGRKYLKPNQQELLKRLSEQLTDEDRPRLIPGASMAARCWRLIPNSSASFSWVSPFFLR